MNTCPVCEQPQADGAECEVCGRVGDSSIIAPEAAVEPLEGLEPNAQGGDLAPGGVEPIPEPFPELEPTQQAGAGEVALDPMPELERTTAEPVEVAIDLVPDLEPSFVALPAGERTVLPPFPICRYCRTPSGPGERRCGRCGMQLGLLAIPDRGGPQAGPRLCSCGTPITRSTCPACGARNRTD